MSFVSQTEQKHREMLCEIGRRLWGRGLVAANDGNLSVRVGEDRLICTPSGVSKGFLQPEELVVTDMNGNAVEGGKASSELKMHLAIYRQRKEVKAIVHAHPPHATAFAVTGMSLPRAIMPEMEVLLGHVPLLPYKTPGTKEFADAFDSEVQFSDVFLLSNHGATCIGRTLEEAWYRMESLDQCCRILLFAKQLGPLVEIPAAESAILDRQRTVYRSLEL